MDRSRIVRVFCGKDGHLKCIICDSIIDRRHQKSCPHFVEDGYICLCKYSDNGLIVYDPNRGTLFNNTTDKIVSTIYNCGSNITKCHVENCDSCNLKIVIDKHRGT